MRIFGIRKDFAWLCARFLDNVLDRKSTYVSEGWAFESLRVHHFFIVLNGSEGDQKSRSHKVVSHLAAEVVMFLSGCFLELPGPELNLQLRVCDGRNFLQGL